jgi:hypothetical protein
VAGSSTESVSTTDGSGSRALSGMQRPGSIVRGPGPAVSFAGGAGAGDEDTSGSDTLSVMGAPSPGSRGALLSKANRMAGYAPSVAAGSEYRGRGAQSVAGSQVARSGGGRPATATSGPASDCLSLHGVLVLCKEVGAALTRFCSTAATYTLLTSSKCQHYVHGGSLD